LRKPGELAEEVRKFGLQQALVTFQARQICLTLVILRVQLIEEKRQPVGTAHKDLERIQILRKDLKEK